MTEPGPPPAPDLPANPDAAAPDAVAASPEPGAEPGAVPQTGAPVEEEEERRRRRRLLLLLFLLLLLLALLAMLTGWYLLFRKPINELLPPVGGDDVPEYLFSIYDADKPMGVATTASGDRIYVTESAGDKLVNVYDGDGNRVGELKPPADRLVHTPVYVAVDPDNGDVWVTDRASGAVYIYDSTGNFKAPFKPKVPIDTWQPLGIALSPDGDVWVTDLSAPFHRIEVFGRDGTLKRTIGQQGVLDFPNMIAFDAAGNAYVTDSNNGRLIVIDEAGNMTPGVGPGVSPGALGLPRGTAVDDVGRLYVVDATGHAVHLYRTGGSETGRPEFIDDFGAEGSGNGQFAYPNGVATDDRARVYVTDRENDRVQVWGY